LRLVGVRRVARRDGAIGVRCITEMQMEPRARIAIGRRLRCRVLRRGRVLRRRLACARRCRCTIWRKEVSGAGLARRPGRPLEAVAGAVSGTRIAAVIGMWRRLRRRDIGRRRRRGLAMGGVIAAAIPRGARRGHR
jgi:hypothetical protein